jgi:hypothetical protein
MQVTITRFVQNAAHRVGAELTEWLLARADSIGDGG